MLQYIIPSQLQVKRKTPSTPQTPQPSTALSNTHFPLRRPCPRESHFHNPSHYPLPDATRGTCGTQSGVVPNPGTHPRSPPNWHSASLPHPHHGARSGPSSPSPAPPPLHLHLHPSTSISLPITTPALNSSPGSRLPHQVRLHSRLLGQRVSGPLQLLGEVGIEAKQ
jgi:hypothetical protein